MSPEAKGKIERPYRWLQDRIVRRCAKAGIADITGARDILAGMRVELHIIPEQPAPEIRLWYQNRLRRSYRVKA